MPILCTFESVNEWGREMQENFSPFWRGGGTKTAPPGHVFDSTPS